MDNLTHTLAGIALSQAGFNRKTRFSTLALVVASNLPDVDLAWSFGGGATYLNDHRDITHSIVGVVALAGLLAGVLYGIGRRAKPPRDPFAPPLRAGWLFAACLAGTALHLLMDFTNAYGVRPFLPFSGRWYAWDIMPIIDPLLLGILLAALLLPLVSRLVSEEVGTRRSRHGWGAVAGLVLMALLWGLRDLAHRRVLNMVNAHTYRDENPLRAAAFPISANPFAWKAVVETSSAYYVLAANALADDVNVEQPQVFYRDQPAGREGEALSIAMKTRTAVVFADFARFLWPQVEPTDNGGYQVTLHDLRFGPSTFTARVELDQNLRVVSERFSFEGR